MTSLQEQQKEQRRWVGKGVPFYVRRAENLILSEFDRGLSKAITHKLLKRLFSFAVKGVPFYKSLIHQKHAISESEINLEDFPILSKQVFQNHSSEFEVSRLPRGEKVVGFKSTSGTTGRPTKVYFTGHSWNSFMQLKQREYRWFGVDPMKTLASIRLPNHFPKTAGEPLKEMETLQRESWPMVGMCFKTGKFLGFSVLNSIDEQLKWLKENDPSYLLAYAESLEHLAFANEGSYLGNGLEQLFSISETLTHDMKERIQTTFKVPVQQNYGLNEVGLVATRCPEGGRYHVHNEFFYVEIVNSKGEACKPGERGRIIVTGLLNYATVLIRYDTDDIAEATDQNCPCGRKLFCFGEVHGRYSRIAFLPEGTLGVVAILREAMTKLPRSLSRTIRKFQIHQNLQNEYELRLQLTETMSMELKRYFQNIWLTEKKSVTSGLEVIQVDRLQSGESGKFHDFISEYMPSYKST